MEGSEAVHPSVLCVCVSACLTLSVCLSVCLSVRLSDVFMSITTANPAKTAALIEMPVWV